MKSKILIFILLFVVVAECAILFGGGAYTRTDSEVTRLETEPVPDTLSGPEIITERNRWSDIIDEIGGARAYDEFKKEYADKSFGTQHLAAHIMGTLLYEKLGIKGQAICDSTFSFGCYHSFFSKVLDDKGLSVIAQLNQVCLDTFGPLGSGCQHGIGHGVMDYYGPDHLLDALNACKPTTAMSEIAGCTSGVFMEYNTPIIITDTTATATPRPIDTKDPYAPCPALPQKFQESCYYSIGQWWDQTDPYRGDWKTQGELCKNIPDPTHMETCYLGIGNVVAPDNNFDPAKSIASCKQMPDDKSIVICQAGASWSFAANPQYKPLAVQMCNQLSPADTQECLRRGNLLNPSNQ